MEISEKQLNILKVFAKMNLESNTKVPRAKLAKAIGITEIKLGSALQGLIETGYLCKNNFFRATGYAITVPGMKILRDEGFLKIE